MTFCTAVYDPPKRADRRDTHTCDLDDEHDGPHHCDLCDTWWIARTEVAPTAAVQEARGAVIKMQVAAARRDADLLGVGWVQIKQRGDGTYAYARITPDRVVLKVTLDELELDSDDVEIPAESGRGETEDR